mgnify:CR=1 FL=1
METARRGSRSCLFEGNGRAVETPVYDWDRMAPGHRVSGPALIEEHASTTVVQPGDDLRVDELGNLQIAIGSDRS